MADPVGRYVAGPTYLVWCQAGDLAGSIHWGVHDERDGRDMLAIMEFVAHAALAGGACILMDCRAIGRIDADMLVEFTTRARDRLPRWSPHIRRQAVLVPDGVSGLLLAGVLPVLAPTHPFRFESDLDRALAFLDHPAARASHEAARGVATEVRGRSVLLDELRAGLARDLAGATVTRCSAALGVSRRTLQRELRRRRTSFSDELRQARVGAAVEMLRLSDMKIDAIALRVGFGTGSRMSAALRRELGVNASEVRARRHR